MNIEELLENRHTAELEWVEPWPATGPEGNALTAHITLRASVHDCVNLSRSIAQAHGRPTMGNDAKFLQDFIAVNLASVVPQREATHEAADQIVRLRSALSELTALVRGECGALLDEDRGGSASLSMEIDDLLGPDGEEERV